MAPHTGHCIAGPFDGIRIQSAQTVVLLDSKPGYDYDQVRGAYAWTDSSWVFNRDVTNDYIKGLVTTYQPRTIDLGPNLV